jgi:hypothetical protein
MRDMIGRRSRRVVALWVVTLLATGCSCNWRAKSLKQSLLSLHTAVLIDVMPRPKCALPRPRNEYGIQALVKQRVDLWIRAVSVSDLVRGRALSAVQLEVLDSRGSPAAKASVEPSTLSTDTDGFGNITFVAGAPDTYVIRASFADGMTRSSTYSPWIIVHNP